MDKMMRRRGYMKLTWARTAWTAWTGVALALTMASAPAFAQTGSGGKAAAETLFDEGRKFMADKRYAEACEKFAASHKLEPSVGALLNQARCRDKLGQIASAWTLYREAEALARTNGDRRRARLAKKRSEALAPRVSHMTVMVPDSNRVEGLVITRNGRPVDSAMWNQKAPIDPGEYEIAAESPRREPWSKMFVVGVEGDHAQVEVPLMPLKPEAADGDTAGQTASATGQDAGQSDAASPAQAPAPALQASPAVSRPWGLRRKLAVGSAALGAASMVAAGLLFMQSQGRWSDALDRCDDNLHCDSQGVTLGEQAGTLADGASIAAAVGAAALTAGVVLWLLGDSTERDTSRSAFQPVIGPGQASVNYRMEF